MRSVMLTVSEHKKMSMLDHEHGEALRERWRMGRAPVIKCIGQQIFKPS
jgi:hypothetical protein